jgi:hypothetical protein
MYTVGVEVGAPSGFHCDRISLAQCRKSFWQGNNTQCAWGHEGQVVWHVVQNCLEQFTQGDSPQQEGFILLKNLTSGRQEHRGPMYSSSTYCNNRSGDDDASIFSSEDCWGIWSFLLRVQYLERAKTKRPFSIFPSHVAAWRLSRTFPRECATSRNSNGAVVVRKKSELPRRFW